MFNKLLVCLLPLVALVGCKGGSEPGPEPGPEPEPEPTPQPGSDIPLNFTCEKGSVTIRYIFQNFASLDVLNLEYSFDRQNWIPIEVKEGIVYNPEIITTIDEKQPTVYFRGNNPDGFNFYPTSETGVGSNFTHFTFRFSDASEDLSLKVSGNIMSLLAPEGFENKFDIPRTGCFSSLFSGAKLNEEQGYDASGLMLPAVKLKERTYYTMFEGSDIAKAPSCLPAVNAKAECYENMFYSDDKLETAPIIKLKTLADEACQFMFYGCAKLNVTEKTGATLFFTCPNDEEFNFAVFRMFAYTAGSFTETPSVGETYYYN